jgi:hypothetical protein
MSGSEAMNNQRILQSIPAIFAYSVEKEHTHFYTVVGFVLGIKLRIKFVPKCAADTPKVM